jgi:isoleucyl-tRNA synthetase
MRRQLDLAVEDFITVEIMINDARLHTLLNKEKIGLMIVTEFMADEVRAKTPTAILLTFLKPGERIHSPELIKDWDVEGVQMTIGISRAPD